MRLMSPWPRVYRGMVVGTLLLTTGGTTFVLSGCDADTSALVLSGFQDLTTTLLDAAFTELANQLAEDSTTTTDTTTTSSS